MDEVNIYSKYCFKLIGELINWLSTKLSILPVDIPHFQHFNMAMAQHEMTETEGNVKEDLNNGGPLLVNKLEVKWSITILDLIGLWFTIT